jgi:dihydroxyacetone synthase
MSPSFEFYDKVSHEMPVKPIPTKVHGVIGVAAVELKDIEKTDLVLKYFRCYVADLCQQFSGGE